MAKINTSKQKIEEILTRGVEKIYPSKEKLASLLVSGKKIKLYCGFDPTAPSLHLGHQIQIRKLAQFQALGHEVIFLIGDFTAQIGDPTDKLATRKKLSRKEVLKNLKNYQNQAGRILKFSGKNPARVMFNSSWTGKLNANNLIEIFSHFTVHEMLTREMFQERIKQKKQVHIHEILYPIFQAYDSVVLGVDLEIGGNDQLFNMLCGRDLMKAVSKKEKFVLTLKLLTDEKGKKMSKTEGNAISLDDSPAEMFGKVMAWPDSMIVPGFELCTDLTIGKIRELGKNINLQKINPKNAKEELAKKMVQDNFGVTLAISAEKEFEAVFKDKKVPQEIPGIKISDKELNILDFLIKAKLANSKAQARRLVEQGGVKIDNEIKKNWQEQIKIRKGQVAQVGKRKFIKIT